MRNCFAASTALLLMLSSCNRSPPPDDFSRLKDFEYDLSKICSDNPEIRCYPRLNVGLANGYVVSINIDGKGLNKLPKSIYQFYHLTEFSLMGTAFDQMPDLKPFSSLRKVTIEYNIFKGPVHLKNLPSSIEDLMLSRDGITEVIVDDSLPHLSLFDLTQNRIEGRINSTFCKLPKLDFLDISSGCCLSDAQQTERANAARKILCKKDVGVSANRSFID